MKPFYYSPAKNRDALYRILQSLDVTKIWRIKIDEQDERTLEQNAKMHAMLSDIAEQSKHLNRVLDVDSWKRLCVAQFKSDCIENDIPRLADYWKKQHFEIIPSLDGKTLVQLGTQTRDFPKYVTSGFIEWLFHFGAVHNIIWSDKSHDFTEYEIERYGT